MKDFMDKDFLLSNDTAAKLYHTYAQPQPIIDYHCHLDPRDIAADTCFENLTRIWLNGDHYKWRAMRTNGIHERYCSGDASDKDKFMKWAETVPATVKNPLFHWTHLELSRYFGINKILNPQTAGAIYEEASEKLRTQEFSVRNLLRKMNVELVCTTDDPIDNLEFHKKIHDDGFEIKVVPAWRPDKAMSIENPAAYNIYLSKLEASLNSSIHNFYDMMEALKSRHQFFHDNGCRLSDHGLDTFYAEEYTEADIRFIFHKVREGKTPDAEQIAKFKSAMLYHLAVMDQEAGWVQQFHVGPMRNNNTGMFNSIGPDTGFDSIGDKPVAQSMSWFLDKLAFNNKLAKTILYNLNPADNEVYATMIGNFQDGTTPGKIQWGAAWWFLDQKPGMERHLETLSSLGLLSRFVGMLTDSRSFLSFPRHEYFRRTLCNMIGKDIENGEIPNDMDWIGNMVADICYRNARNYFNFWN
ncbi:MAG: glucuronate isomerase [Bacteroidetes bacterium]|nr:glucuronate isomerase [Bacteroidota bacterium]